VWLVWLLVACASAPPIGGGGDPLVVSTNPAAPAGGVLYAKLFDLSGPLPDAAIDGVPLVPAWGSVDGRSFGIWEIPADLPVGDATLTFAGSGRNQEVGFTLSEGWFADVGPAVGLDVDHVTEKWIDRCAESLTGIAAADFDLDGDQDVVVGNLMAESRFFLNEAGAGRMPEFTDVTEATGFSGWDLVASVQIADYDNDGDPDIFLGRRGANALLADQMVETGALSFLDRTAEAGLPAVDQRTTGVGWGDYDGDGDLDLYEVTHTWCFPNTSVVEDSRDHLFRNDGGVFVEVSEQLPDDQGQVSFRHGFSAIWADYDVDGDQDLWVVNDVVPQGGRGVLFRNDGPDGSGGWQFTDVTDAWSIWPIDPGGKGVNAMGGAIGDLNADGRPDLMMSNIGFGFLLLSDGGVWRDASAELGVQRPILPWGTRSVTWGVHLVDVDNEGDLDAVWVGGALEGEETEQPQPHALFENRGTEGFVEVSWEAGVASPRHGKASAEVDFDGDGWRDLLIANWADTLEVWRNTLGDRLDRHWLDVEVEGDGDEVSRDAFGAVVWLTTLDDVEHACFRNPMPSMSGTGDPACHFGLGTSTAVAGLTIAWPNGERQAVSVPAVDQRITVVYAP